MAQDYRNALAMAMMQGGMGGQPIRTPLQGFGNLAQVLAGGLMMRGADRREDADRQSDYGVLSEALSGGGGLTFDTLGKLKNQDLAQALMPQMFDEGGERWEPILDEAGNVLGQRSLTTGETKADPRAESLMNPAYFNQRAQLAQMGASRVNNNLPPAERAASVEMAKLDAQRVNEALTLGNSARTSQRLLGQIDQILQQTQTGALEPAKARAAAFLQGLNIDPASVGLESATNAQTLMSLINQGVLANAQQLAGTLSDSDMAILRQTMVSLGNTPQANRQILENAYQQFQGTVDQATAMDQYFRENQSLGGYAPAPAPGVQQSAPPAPPAPIAPPTVTAPPGTELPLNPQSQMQGQPAAPDASAGQPQGGLMDQIRAARTRADLEALPIDQMTDEERILAADLWDELP